MKKLVFFLLFPLLFSAQTHRFIYDYSYRIDSTEAEYEKTSMVLDVNPNSVKFYEYEYAEMDSINKVRNMRNYNWNDTPVLVRQRNSDVNTNFVLIDSYYSYETTDKITWKLLSETKEIAGYQLQKATTDFGGRNWTAWFAKEIAISEGPYKFRGLPGLVFEIEDSGKNFIFSLVKSKVLDKEPDTSDFVESHAKNKALKVSEKIVHKKQLEFFENPLNDMIQEFESNPNTTFMVMNVKVTSKDQFKELTENYQDWLRKSYNPIELSRAVKYPSKKSK